MLFDLWVVSTPESDRPLLAVDVEPFGEKMSLLVKALQGHFAEAERLRHRITSTLAGLLG